MPTLLTRGAGTAFNFGLTLGSGAVSYVFKGFSSTAVSLPGDGIAGSGFHGGALTYSSGAQIFFGVAESSSSAVNQYNTIGPPANGQNWTGGRGVANVGFGYVGSGQYMSAYSNTLNQLLTFGSIDNSISGTVGTGQFWYSTTNPGWGGTGWGNGTVGTWSPNGLDWSPALGLWACTGGSGSGNYGVITSTNGTTWSTSLSTTWGSSNGQIVPLVKWCSGFGTSGIFLSYGMRNAIDNRLLYMTSTNGTSWSSPTLVSAGVAPTVVNLGVPFAYSPKLNRVVIMSDYRSAYTSSGGSLDAPFASVGGAPSTSMFCDVIWNSVANIFITIGYAYGGSTGVYYPCYSTSTDGITWATPTTIQTSTQMNYQIGYALGSLAYSTDTGITCALMYTGTSSKNPVVYYSI